MNLPGYGGGVPPTNTHDLVTRGRQALAAGDPLTAAKLLAEAADTEPDNASLLTDLARAHFHSASLGRAEQVLQRLVEIDPTDGYARMLLGRTLQRQSRREEALTQLRLAVALTDDPEVAMQLFKAEQS